MRTPPPQPATASHDRRNHRLHSLVKPVPGSLSVMMNLTEDDVMLGRGVVINEHPGNMRFRAYVSERKAEYKAGSKREKNDIAIQVLRRVHSCGGRFLRKTSLNNVQQFYYEEVDKRVALEKCKQTLRDQAAPNEAGELPSPARAVRFQQECHPVTGPPPIVSSGQANANLPRLVSKSPQRIPASLCPPISQVPPPPPSRRQGIDLPTNSFHQMQMPRSLLLGQIGNAASDTPVLPSILAAYCAVTNSTPLRWQELQLFRLQALIANQNASLNTGTSNGRMGTNQDRKMNLVPVFEASPPDSKPSPKTALKRPTPSSQSAGDDRLDDNTNDTAAETSRFHSLEEDTAAEALLSLVGEADRPRFFGQAKRIRIGQFDYSRMSSSLGCHFLETAAYKEGNAPNGI